jgi:hypothetical protein
MRLLSVIIMATVYMAGCNVERSDTISQDCPNKSCFYAPEKIKDFFSDFKNIRVKDVKNGSLRDSISQEIYSIPEYSSLATFYSKDDKIVSRTQKVIVTTKTNSGIFYAGISRKAIDKNGNQVHTFICICESGKCDVGHSKKCWVDLLEDGKNSVLINEEGKILQLYPNGWVKPYESGE